MSDRRPDPDRAASLSDAKRALLAKRLRGARQTPDDAIRPRPDGAPLALTPGQQRLWVLHQQDPQSAAYTLAQALRLRGPLDADRLRAAVHAVVQRHEVLRLRIETVDGQPVPRIASEAAPAIGTADVSASGAPLDAATRQATAFVRQPFDLGGPLLRLRLIRLGPDDHVLALALHHIAADEWSLGILWREVAALYADPGARLDPLAIQVADVAHAQRERPDGPDGIAYWMDRLRGLPPLELPADRPPPGETPGALRHRPLPDDLAARLRVLAAGEGVTLFALVLAASQVLLSRLSGQTDLAVGVPVTTRERAEVEPLVGFFLNTLVLRADLADAPTFRSVLGQTRTRLAEGLARRDVPFEQVVDALRAERGRRPLVDAMVVLQQRPDPPSLSGLDTEWVEVENGAAKFDLTLFVTESGDALSLTAEYATRRFSADAVDRILERFERLLGSIADTPGGRVSDLPLLPDAEREALLKAAGGGEVVVPSEGVLGEIARHARATPDAPAVAAGGERLSYGDLWQRAGRLATHLHALGVRPGDRVGLAVERSAAMVTGLLGVLRAGAAYIPLDPAYPDARLQMMLADAGVSALVTRAGYAQRLGSTSITVVDLDAVDLDAVDLGAAADEAPPGLPDLDALAYVLYTSGSTGTPKGVAVTHRNLAASTAARTTVYPDPVGRFLLLSSVAFDSSVAGLFWTLTTGGALVLPPERIEQDVASLASIIETEGVTHTLGLPSLWRVVLDHADPQALASLRVVIAAGEALPPALAAQHHARLPDAAFYNEYGPTEATVWATVHRVPPQVAASRVPVGSPIPGARVYVLDAAGGLAPFGTAGELAVGGAGVARGYVGQPELTDERFGPDPFAPGGGRLYRTGDRARLLPDGTLDLLGRLDAQVKIRGVRVEPGEIEAVLAGDPDVREAAVVYRPSSSRLVAFLIPAREEVSADAVRRRLAARLPAAMVPSQIRLLDALPRTPNGKLDRAALPSDEAEPSAEAVAPRTETERTLVGIWRDVLEADAIGIDDSFFEIGGDSITSIQILARAHQAGLPLTASDFFEHPTVRELAAILDGDGASDESWVVPLAPEGEGTPLFIIHGWGGKVFKYRDLARQVDAGVPIYGIQDIDRDNPSDRFASFEAMAGHYAAEIRRVQPEGPYRLLGFSLGGTLAFAIARRLRADDQAIDRLFVLDTEPMNLPARVHFRVMLPLMRRRLRHHLRAILRNPLGAFERLQRLGGIFRREFHAPDVAPAPADAADIEVPHGDDYYRTLMRSYLPEPCSMSVSFIKTTASEEKFDLPAAWYYLTGRDLDVETVEVDDHDDLILDPDVRRRVAEVVRSRLVGER